MPCYEPPFQPKPVVKPWEIAIIIALGVPGIWLFIHGFFGAMPLIGGFICHHIFAL